LLEPLDQSLLDWKLEPLWIQRGVIAAAVQPTPGEVGTVAWPCRSND